MYIKICVLTIVTIVTEELAQQMQIAGAKFIFTVPALVERCKQAGYDVCMT